MDWVSLLLVSLYVIAAIVVATRLPVIRRRFSRGNLLAGLTLGTAVVVVAELVHTLLHASWWVHYVQGAAILLLLALIGAAVASRKPVTRAEVPKRILVVGAHPDVLVVGAHPDDLELACGGSIARFIDSGHEVYAIVMSRGARGARHGDVDARAREAREGGAFLGLHDVRVHDFTDLRLATEMDEMIGAIETMVGLVRPDVIFTHSSNDQHQDHHAVHLATLRAGRRCSTILCFESPSATPEFSARFFVDIGDYLDVKLAAIKQHANQAGKPYLDDLKVRGKAVHRGEEAKIGYAEGFEVVRALSGQLGSL